MEIRYEVKTILVKKGCTECYDGEMLPNGSMLASSPPQYPHICNNCGARENIRGVKYPRTEYIERIL